MLIAKKVRIDFASPEIKAYDCIGDIRKATEHAGLNLYSRYGIQLQYPMPEDGEVTVEVRIPEELASDFKTGYRLRGISSYLLKHHHDKYSKYLVGNRLLVYTETEEGIQADNSLSEDTKVKAISKFAALLLREDPASKERAERIMDILNEEE